MAELKKLEDGELDAVSGGTKYTIGATPVTVYDVPAGRPICVLYRDRGDYFVTDGQTYWVGGANWAHVYLAHGEGYVNCAVL